MADASGVSTLETQLLLGTIPIASTQFFIIVNTTGFSQFTRVGYLYVQVGQTEQQGGGFLILRAPLYACGIFANFPVTGLDDTNSLKVSVSWNFVNVGWFIATQ